VPDGWAVVLAAATFAGALTVADGHVRGVPLAVGVAVVLAGWLVAGRGRPWSGDAGGPAVRAGARPRRWSGRVDFRPTLLCVGAGLLAAGLAQRSVAGLDAPLTTGPVVAEVALVGDPETDGRGGVRVDVRLDGRRLRATARLSAAAALDDRLAGERVTVIGQVQPPGPYERLVRHRHLAGRLSVDTVVGWRPGEGVTRLANGLRRTLAQGAEGMSERQASLLAGITLGDDRSQPADMADAFRAAGLTHLLAVSGQNVAFVMVIAAPLLTRLRFAPRLATTLAVLALFALVTRAEPSVLRAVAMASVAAMGAALGRPTSTVRTLALGVAAMLLVDPLLATSLGFRLSVAGAAGIVAGAERLEAVVPGPRWLAAPLSVTLSAQAAVSPLLVTTFGSVPLASLPANLLAAPAAGPLMVWGLTGGLVAGVFGGAVADAVHVPTRLMLAWLGGVATAAERWPLGELRAGHLVALGVGAVVLAVARGQERRHHRTLVLGVAGRLTIAGVVIAALVTRGGSVPPPGGQALGAGATLWQGGGATVVVVDGRARDSSVLAGLRDAGARRVDVVVLRSDARSAADLVATLRRVWPVGTVLAPVATSPRAGGGADAAASLSPPSGTVIDVGGLRLVVVANAGGRIEVDVAPRPRSQAMGRSPGLPRSTRGTRPGWAPGGAHRMDRLAAPAGCAERGAPPSARAWRRPILGRRDRARPPACFRRGDDRAHRWRVPRSGGASPGRRGRAGATVRARGRGAGRRRRGAGPRRRPCRRSAARSVRRRRGRHRWPPCGRAGRVSRPGGLGPGRGCGGGHGPRRGGRRSGGWGPGRDRPRRRAGWRPGGPGPRGGGRRRPGRRAGQPGPGRAVVRAAGVRLDALDRGRRDRPRGRGRRGGVPAPAQQRRAAQPARGRGDRRPAGGPTPGRPARRGCRRR
jgi:competence protein ComEC